jgi:hypothetical protein
MAIMDVEIIDIEICVDCAVWHANGDFGDLEGDDLSAVIVPKGLDDGWIVSVGEPVGFSWSSCDCCDRALGGDRFSAHAFAR